MREIGPVQWSRINRPFPQRNNAAFDFYEKSAKGWHVTVCCSYPNWVVGQARRAAEDCFVAGRGSLLQGLLLALQSATEKYKMLQDVARKPQLFCTEEKSNLLWVAVPGLPLRRCWVAHEAKQRVELRGLKTHVLGSLSTCPLPQKPEQQTHSTNKRRKSRICLAALQKVLDLHSGPPLVVFLFAPFLVVLRRISILSRNL